MENSTTIIRLLNLINRLYKGEKLTTKNISDIYEVSRRMAQRYIEYLKKAGFDIKKEKNRYFLDFGLDEEVLEDFARKIGLDGAFIVNKVKENVFYSKLDVEKIDLYKFEIIEKAIKEKKELIGKYDLQGEIVEISFKPLKITNFDGYWYVNALNYKDEYRTYHINTFKSIKLTNKTFEIKKNILDNLDKAINIWYDPFKKPILVELLADKEAVKYLKRVPLSKTQVIYENPDKTYTITLQITHHNEILRKLLMWIPHIVVISPKELKEEVDNQIKKYINNFLK